MIPEDEFIKIMLTVEKVLKPNGKVIITTPNLKVQYSYYIKIFMIRNINLIKPLLNFLHMKATTFNPN